MRGCNASLSEAGVFPRQAVHAEGAPAVSSGVLLFKHLLSTCLHEAPCRAYANNSEVWFLTLRSLVVSWGRKGYKQTIAV